MATADESMMAKRKKLAADQARKEKGLPPLEESSPSSSSEDEFQFPSSEERRKEISLTVEELRKRIEKDRAEGRARGEELFGEGTLGRLGPSGTLEEALAQAQTITPQAQASLGALGDPSISPLNLPGTLGPLKGADTSQIKAAAGTAEGFGTDFAKTEQEMRELATRRLNQATASALRTQRGTASARGITGATASAREGDILKSALQTRADLETSLAADSLGRREREAGLRLQQRALGTQAATSAAGLEQQAGLAQGAQDVSVRGQDLGAQISARGQDIGAILETRSQDAGFSLGQAQALTQAAQTQGNLVNQIAQLEQQRSVFDLGQAGIERQQQLQTELANVGLAAAIESGGASRALQSLQQDVSIEFGKKSLANEEAAINKPAPEAPDAGLSYLCTLCHEKGDISNLEFFSDNLMMGTHGPEAYRGYALWAAPLKKLCEKYDFVYRLVRIPVKAWCRSMHEEVLGLEPKSKIGRFLGKIGSAICRKLGEML